MTKAFLLGVEELEKEFGPDAAEKWMRGIGDQLAEIEGPGVMGEGEPDKLGYFTICLFAPKLNEFVESTGGIPKGHEKILRDVRGPHEGDKAEEVAAVNVCCDMCHAYRKKRALMAGKKNLLHLAAKSKLTGAKEINEAAMKKANVKASDVKKLLKEKDCIFKYV